MITLRPSAERGHFDHGWLDTHHSFSFAEYHDPDFMGFRTLRVLNQDRVAPGQGFGTHGHRDMEIVTYVLEGALQHRDSMGNGSLIRPGDVQLMSAGTGVTHSEFNGSQQEPVEFLQMWVLPGRQGTRPRYEQKSFPPEARADRLRLVVSPDGRDGSVSIGQEASMYAGLLAAGSRVEQRLDPRRGAWIHVARGRARVGDAALGPGDGAAIQRESALAIEALEPSDVVLWELA